MPHGFTSFRSLPPSLRMCHCFCPLPLCRRVDTSHVKCWAPHADLGLIERQAFYINFDPCVPVPSNHCLATTA